MKSLAKFALLTLAAIGLISIAIAVIPHSAYTVAAQAVGLVRDADMPVRHSWVATCTLSGPVTADIPCTPTPMVPRDRTVIIHSIDFAATVSPTKTNGDIILTMTTTTGGVQARWDRPYSIVSLSDLSAFQTLGPVPISGTLPVSVSMIMYADAGTPVEVHGRMSMLSPDVLHTPETANGKVMLIGNYVTP